MTYDARTRDRYRLAVTAMTAAVAAGAVAAGGLVTGAVAHDHAVTAAAQQARRDALARERYNAWVARYGHPERVGVQQTVLRARPIKTRVTTRYVVAAPQAAPGRGGSVTNARSAQSPAAPAPLLPVPPPPPPPPPPAPSTGS